MQALECPRKRSVLSCRQISFFKPPKTGDLSNRVQYHTHHTMVRCLQQCNKCRKRFVAQSTESADLLCPRCESFKPHHDALPIKTGPTSPLCLTSKEEGESVNVPDGSVPENHHTNEEIAFQYAHCLKSNHGAEPTPPPDTIDLLSCDSHDDDDNDSRPDGLGDEGDSDEEAEIPLAQVLSKRKVCFYR